jgi:hypothetical protein
MRQTLIPKKNELKWYRGLIYISEKYLSLSIIEAPIFFQYAIPKLNPSDKIPITVKIILFKISFF